MAKVVDGALTIPAAVREIIDTDLTDDRIANFINMAYVTRLPLSGKLGTCGGDAALAQIEQMLAAHFMTVYAPTVKSESIAGEWSVTYAMKDGEGLRSSRYGQNAIVLDCSGTLASLGSKQARLSVISHYERQNSKALFDPDLL